MLGIAGEKSRHLAKVREKVKGEVKIPLPFDLCPPLAKGTFARGLVRTLASLNGKDSFMIPESVQSVQIQDSIPLASP